jgi:alpha-1,3/alpha-1,6-mannosyltransferase
MTGGYDKRVQENVVYHSELVALAESLGLKAVTTNNIVTATNITDDVDVLFLLSVPNTLKEMLLNSARLLIYTPSDEHFGIVPLEAMLAGVPVLAANSGGPLETIVDGVSGWHLSPDEPERWTSIMQKAAHEMSDAEIKKMGKAGKERVKREFSDVKMAERLDGIIDSMAQTPRKSPQILSSFVWTIAVVIVDTAYYLASQNPGLKKFESMLLPPLMLTAVSMISWIAYLIVDFSGQGRERQRPTR